MVFAEAIINDELYQIRDLEEGDISVIVDYWHNASPEFLELMGADPAKLRSREATAEKFRTALPGDPLRNHIAIVVSSPRRGMIGYSNVYLDEKKNGYAHVHIVSQGRRALGIASALFPKAISLFASQFSIRKLIFLTCLENDGVNRLLEKFGLKPELFEERNPSGMARAGTFYRYVVDLSPFSQEP